MTWRYLGGSVLSAPSRGAPVPDEPMNNGEARRRARQVVAEGGEGGPRGRADGPEDRPLSERCISYGVPRLQANYNSHFQIVQSPETVVVYQEMIHDGRMVNMTGAPHLPSNVGQRCMAIHAAAGKATHSWWNRRTS